MRPELAAFLTSALLCLALLFASQAALAEDASGVDAPQLQVERSDEGLFLSATVRFEIPALVEDALLKGIPIFFVIDAEVLRERWYWADEKLASSARYMRLIYQPLTRRWRLNVSPTPIGNSGLGVTLSQNFDDLGEAMSAVQRVSRWKIADADAAPASARPKVEFRFRLDTTQLPQPLQIGIVGRSDWNLSFARTLQLSGDAAR